MSFPSSRRTNGVLAEDGSPPAAAPEPPRGLEGSLGEQDCSSPDTSEQALLGGAALGASRTVSRSEPDLSSATANTEKATESTAIMIDVQESAVVQSEDPSLFPESLGGEFGGSRELLAWLFPSLAIGCLLLPGSPRQGAGQGWRQKLALAPYLAKALVFLQLATRPTGKPAP